MYGCESWTVKKAERRRIDAFELWCWRRLLRVPWTVRRSNQSILKETSPWVFIGRTDAEAETPVPWPAHDLTHWKRLWCWEGLGQEEKGMTEDEMAGWHHQLDAHEFRWTPGVGDGQGGLVCCSSWVTKSWTQLSDWPELRQSRIQVYGSAIFSHILHISVHLCFMKRDGVFCGQAYEAKA